MAGELERLIARQGAELDRLSAEELRRADRLLRDAQRELREGLEAWIGAGKGEDRFTVARSRAVLAQVEAAIERTGRRLGVTVSEAAAKGEAAASRQLAGQVAAASREFGVARVPLANALERGTPGALLLDRHLAGSRRWTAASVERARSMLAVEQLKRSTLSQAVDALTGPEGVLSGRRAAARRLVLTEFAHAQNRKALENIRRAGGMKRLVSVLDSRTAADSLAIIARPGNTVRAVDEEFEDPLRGSTFLFPPNRPNDRARIVYFSGSEGERQQVETERAKAAEMMRTRADEVRRVREQARAERARREAERPLLSASVPRDKVAGLERRVREIEAEIGRSPVEHLVAVDADGRTLKHIESYYRDRIDIPEDAMPVLRKAAALVHVHPGGTPPSWQDLYALLAHRWRPGIRVVGPARMSGEGRLARYFLGWEGTFPDEALVGRIVTAFRLETLIQEQRLAEDFPALGLSGRDAEYLYVDAALVAIARRVPSLKYRKAVE